MEELNNYPEKKRDSYDDDDCTHTALFTVGTALVAAGLKRATVVLFMLKQWHLWVFLLLNLLLLAILFTSAVSAPSRSSRGGESDSATSVRREGRKRKMVKSRHSRPPMARNHDEDRMRKDYCPIADGSGAEPMEECELSDEELNERVESFIASFRQQLVLDARK